MSRGYVPYLQEWVLPNHLWACPTAVAQCWEVDADTGFNCYSSTAVKEISGRHWGVLVSSPNPGAWTCFVQLEIRPAQFWISNSRNVQNPALKMESGLSCAVDNGLGLSISYCRHLYICFLSLSGRKC